MSVAVFRHGWDSGVARDLASNRRQFMYAEVLSTYLLHDIFA